MVLEYQTTAQYQNKDHTNSIQKDLLGIYFRQQHRSINNFIKLQQENIQQSLEDTKVLQPLFDLPLKQTPATYYYTYNNEALRLIKCNVRPSTGRIMAQTLRMDGYIPIMLKGQNGKKIYLRTEKNYLTNMVLELSKDYFMAKVYWIQVVDLAEDGSDISHFYRSTVTNVNINTKTDAVENVNMQHCPRDCLVMVQVPVELVGKHICPALREKGTIKVKIWILELWCYGASIPTFIGLDVSNLNFGQQIKLKDVVLPEGVVTKTNQMDTVMCEVDQKMDKEYYIQLSREKIANTASRQAKDQKQQNKKK